MIPPPPVSRADKDSYIGDGRDIPASYAGYFERADLPYKRALSGFAGDAPIHGDGGVTRLAGPARLADVADVGAPVRQ